MMNGCHHPPVPTTPHETIYQDFFDRVASQGNQSYAAFAATFTTLKDDSLGVDLAANDRAHTSPPHHLTTTSSHPLRLEWEAAAEPVRCGGHYMMHHLHLSEAAGPVVLR